MKILTFSLLALVGLLLVALQHQQLGRLRSENANLQGASAEATQLQADLAKATGDAAQNEEEIARLREENRDLLKLRSEVSELRDARAEFEKVTIENKRLQALAANAPKPAAKQTSMQPILIRVDSLYDRGLSTPETALQTFLWAEHTRNTDALFRCLASESQARTEASRRSFGGAVSIQIVARRDLNATTVQLGIQTHTDDSRWDQKAIITLVLQNGEWRVDITQSK